MTTIIDITKVPAKALIAELSSRGRQLGQDGVDRAEAAAACWLDEVMPVFRDWLMVRTESFAIEEFRICLLEHRPELMPESHKAWGAFTQAAVKRGLIAPLGSRRAASQETHGKPVGTYQRAFA